MNKSDIITLPHKSLRKISKKISIVDQDVLAIVEGMKSATLDWEESRDHEVGVALAAVQVDKLYKIIILKSDFNDKNNKNFEVLVNPKIIKYEGEITEDYEGCLSVKDIYGKIPRYSKVRVKAKDLKGREVRLKADGFLARVLQHEIDHTKGIIFVDHIKDAPEAFYKLGDSGKIEEMSDDEKSKIFNILW